MATERWGVALVPIALLVGLWACGPPVSAVMPEDDTVDSAVAETLSAASTSTAAAQPTLTPTLEPTPSATSTPSVTPTPAPSARLTRDTNCRTGPLRVYDLIVTVLQGQEVQILGRNAEGTYWFVVDPTSPDRACWLWARYAEVRGDTVGVPVFTPPPSPTPAYDWSGEWTVYLNQQGTMNLHQSGTSISGTLAGDDEVFDLFGTTSDGGRVVNGEIEVTPPAKITFTWRMLEDKQQFVGSFTRIDEGTPEAPEQYCGARSGQPMPDPCQWP